MVSLRRQKRCIFIRVQNENIAHYFHEQLQYLWITLSTIRDRNVSVYTDARQLWNRDITRSVVEGLGFQFLEKRPPWWQVRTVDLLPGIPAIFHPEAPRGIRDLVYARHLGLERPPATRKILYTRGDAFRRRMCNYERLAPLFDIVVNSLQLSFQEHVQLFSSASHMVSIEGANMTNIVLMQPNSAVFSIQVGSQNSWPLMFGTASLVRTFDAEFIAKDDMLVAPQPLGIGQSSSHNGRRLRGSGLHDMDVVVNDLLHERVAEFLSDGPVTPSCD